MQLGISIVALSTLIAILVLRPRSSAGAGLGLVLAAGLLLGGVAPRSTGRLLVESTLPLVAFLTGAIWLALYAEQVGVSRWLADHLLVAARGRPVALLGLVALVAAALTATVSLDGAIVLVVPLILDLVRAAPALRGALLGVGIAVTNAFSFAVPQGNPANLVLIQRLHLSPGAFVAHLAVPATLATAVCLLGVAIAERRGLRDARIERVRPVRRERSLRPALLVLGAAAAGGVAAPWLGIASWLPLSVVALAAWIVLRLGDRHPPRLPVPWRVGAQIAALLVCAESFVDAAGLPRAQASSPAGLVAVALSVAAVASLVNNLPASVLVAGILSGPPATAYATLIGLAPGSLATPHGSVATMLAFQRAGDEPAFVRYVRWWLPISLAAVVVAVLALR